MWVPLARMKFHASRGGLLSKFRTGQNKTPSHTRRGLASLWNTIGVPGENHKNPTEVEYRIIYLRDSPIPCGRKESQLFTAAILCSRWDAVYAKPRRSL